MGIKRERGRMTDVLEVLGTTSSLSSTSYTFPMKTAVSIADDLFREADEAAARLGWSRSKLYAQAIRRFLEDQGEDPVTAALDAMADDLNASGIPDSGRALIDSGDWAW